MLKNINLIKKQIKIAYNQHFSRIIEINKKYAKPSIEMSTPVKIALLILRIYLIVLVGLLVFKFTTMLIWGGSL